MTLNQICKFIGRAHIFSREYIFQWNEKKMYTNHKDHEIKPCFFFCCIYVAAKVKIAAISIEIQCIVLTSSRINHGFLMKSFVVWFLMKSFGWIWAENTMSERLTTGLERPFAFAARDAFQCLGVVNFRHPEWDVASKSSPFEPISDWETLQTMKICAHCVTAIVGHFECKWDDFLCFFRTLFQIEHVVLDYCAIFSGCCLNAHAPQTLSHTQNCHAKNTEHAIYGNHYTAATEFNIVRYKWNS